MTLAATGLPLPFRWRSQLLEVVRRSIWLRAFLAAWTFWFTAALLEAPGVHACGVHGGSGGHHAAAPGATEHSHHASGPGAPAESATCTCLGHCCGVSQVIARTDNSIAAIGLLRSVDPDFAAPIAAPVVRRPYDRPFANGPPVA